MSLSDINCDNSENLLLADIRQLIDEARQRVAASFNSEITLMYWHIGERINREFLDNKRAEYGKQIVATLARQLQEEFGSKGFDAKSIRRMMQFARVFPDLKIVAPLARQLSWSHFVEVIAIDNSLQLDNAGIKVANYLTELPPKELLQAQLQKSLVEVKARNENNDMMKGDAADE